MSAPESAAVTPGQAAYELWAQVMATNGVDCDPWGWLGNVEQMAWREVERQPQPAPGDAPELRIEDCGAHNGASHLQINTGHNWLCTVALAPILAEYEPQPAGDVKPAPELAAAMAEAWPGCNDDCCNPDLPPEPEFPAAKAALARVLSWFPVTGTRNEATATRAQLAHAYQDGELGVPDELRRFL